MYQMETDSWLFFLLTHGNLNPRVVCSILSMDTISSLIYLRIIPRLKWYGDSKPWSQARALAGPPPLIKFMALWHWDYETRPVGSRDCHRGNSGKPSNHSGGVTQAPKQGPLPDVWLLTPLWNQATCPNRHH
jgi:hypothetical protein